MVLLVIYNLLAWIFQAPHHHHIDEIEPVRSRHCFEWGVLDDTDLVLSTFTICAYTLPPEVLHSALSIVILCPACPADRFQLVVLAAQSTSVGFWDDLKSLEEAALDLALD